MKGIHIAIAALGAVAVGAIVYFVMRRKAQPEPYSARVAEGQFSPAQPVPGKKGGFKSFAQSLAGFGGSSVGESVGASIGGPPGAAVGKTAGGGLASKQTGHIFSFGSHVGSGNVKDAAKDVAKSAVTTFTGGLF